jgi:rhamnogalacturonyl hydrolase YesR
MGDRGEFDQDNSGRGKLYIGTWDRKIHLYGAEWGAWLVDKDAKFWGSWPVTGDSSSEFAEAREEVVQYYDIDGNGFIDKITYDYNGDKEVDFAVSLLDYKTKKNPHPDVQEIFNPAKAKWEGMHETFIEIAEQSWQEAWTLYRVIWKKGLSDRELDELLVASSIWEKYDHAYWFKECLIRKLRGVESEETSREIDRLYYTGNIESLALYLEQKGSEIMDSLNAKSEQDIYSDEFIKATMKRVFRYQVAHLTPVEPAFWERGALYTGIVAAYRATGDEEYLDNALEWGEECKWQINKTHGGFLNADNQVALQSYCDLYMIKGGDEKITAAREALDKMVDDPPVGRENWWWCDALYMSPPFMARMAKITGDKKYTELMNAMWWDTYDFLYDKDVDLFYRDKNFFDKKTKNGKKMFWSRGNGWVLAGIAHVLDYLSEDDPHYDDFVRVFKEMAHSLAEKQGPDGLWRTSLLDYDEYPMPETSGTGFYCHAMAWGINKGILDRDEYLPVVRKAWEGLTRCVYPDGKLGWTQMVAGSPGGVSPQLTREYSVGAFLLTASEMLKLNDSK